MSLWYPSHKWEYLNHTGFQRASSCKGSRVLGRVIPGCCNREVHRGGFRMQYLHSQGIYLQEKAPWQNIKPSISAICFGCMHVSIFFYSWWKRLWSACPLSNVNFLWHRDILQDNVISTPETSGTILPGITRKSIIEIALTLGYKVT